MIAWSSPLKPRLLHTPHSPEQPQTRPNAARLCPGNGKSHWRTSEGSRVPSSNTAVNSRSKGHRGTRGRERRLPAMGTTPGPAGLPGTAAPQPRGTCHSSAAPAGHGACRAHSTQTTPATLQSRILCISSIAVLRISISEANKVLHAVMTTLYLD